MNSPDLERDLAGARSAHARLLVTIASLTDSQARQPSLLPDWSVGHVLTHIAQDYIPVVASVGRRFTGCRRVRCARSRVADVAG